MFSVTGGGGRGGGGGGASPLSPYVISGRDQAVRVVSLRRCVVHVGWPPTHGQLDDAAVSGRSPTRHLATTERIAPGTIRRQALTRPPGVLPVSPRCAVDQMTRIAGKAHGVRPIFN